jgi:Protein of unknown function (DUF1289).
MTVFVINGMGIATAWNILPCYQAVDCGEFVGFIPALKREAFSSILRNIDESKEACSNCGRTLDQIAIWTGMTPSERQEIIEELKEMGYPKPDA